MTDLTAFLRRHIEAFLDYEFGEAMAQNTTPPGMRHFVWTSEHTQRLVLHLASNWKVVEEAQRLQPGEPAFPTADPGEIAHDNAQAEAAEAEWDNMPEEDRPMRRDDLPW